MGCLVSVAVSASSETQMLASKAGSGDLVGFLAFVAAFSAMTLLPLTIRISREAHWLEIEHINAAVAAWVLTPGSLIASRIIYPGFSFDSDLHPRDALLLGGLSFLALCLQTRGYQYTEASLAAMMWYVQVPFSYTLQFLVFKEVPSRASCVGASCVLLAAALNVYGARPASASSARHALETDSSAADMMLLECDT
eukprot:TRINITY_DN48776_c0_g1_i1.p1 TRINITY_DN48776_c0_g1~~TRINITY_DN48776_c0_g1_i1.p1  ORF type:complete len:220 (+),score=35.64 TRINITY_DN48776_c0_g1_i1:75-662(+)